VITLGPICLDVRFRYLGIFILTSTCLASLGACPGALAHPQNPPAEASGSPTPTGGAGSRSNTVDKTKGSPTSSAKPKGQSASADAKKGASGAAASHTPASKPSAVIPATSPAATPAPSPTAIAISPSPIQPDNVTGLYPTTEPITISVTDCATGKIQFDSKTDALAPLAGDDVKLTAAKQTVGSCTITATLAITNHAAPANYPLTVMRSGKALASANVVLAPLAKLNVTVTPGFVQPIAGQYPTTTQEVELAATGCPGGNNQFEAKEDTLGITPSGPGVTIGPNPVLGDCTIDFGLNFTSEATAGKYSLTVKRGGTQTVASANFILTTSMLPSSYQITPRVILPTNGKYPSTVNIAMSAMDCGEGKSEFDPNIDAIFITGAGVAPSAPKVGTCLISSTLTIDPAATADSYSLTPVLNGQPLRSVDLQLMDTNATAIPPGLNPQLDVMWGVLTQKDCSDLFGSRVASRVYCIEVKMGNNTGHSIQIAGMGFDLGENLCNSAKEQWCTLPNISYASTRAVLQKGQIWSDRNIAYNALRAAGILVTSATPFIATTGAQATFATSASIVTGPALAAFDLIWPDETINQLQNLDNESFRDTQIITNNSSIRTMVFIEKNAVTQAIHSLTNLAKPSITTKSSDNANNVSKGNSADTPVTITQKTPTVMVNDSMTFTANVPVKWSVQGKQKKNGSIDQVSGRYTAPATKPAGPVTVTAARVDDQGKTDTATVTIENPSPTNPAGLSFEARRSATEENSIQQYRMWHRSDFDPYIVKRALNSLVVVGNQIEYLQRMQVVSSTIPATTVTITKKTATLMINDSMTFTANVPVTWSVSGDPKTVGTIDKASGEYTAPGTAGSVTVTATSVVDQSKTDTATVTIQVPPKTSSPTS